MLPTIRMSRTLRQFSDRRTDRDRQTDGKTDRILASRVPYDTTLLRRVDNNDKVDVPFHFSQRHTQLCEFAQPLVRKNPSLNFDVSKSFLGLCPFRIYMVCWFYLILFQIFWPFHTWAILLPHRSESFLISFLMCPKASLGHALS